MLVVLGLGLAGPATGSRPFGTGPTAQSSTGAGYFLSPQQVSVAPAARCTLDVSVAATGDSIGCVQSWVAFDTSYVSLVKSEEGPLFKESGVPTLFFTDPIAADTNSVEGCILGYRTFVPAPGGLTRYIFEAKRPGLTAVRIVRLVVWDIDRVMFEPVYDPAAWISIGTPTGIGGGRTKLRRLTVYPNPSNPAATLLVDLEARESAVNVSVTIYSSNGRRVRTLFEGTADPGRSRYEWDGRSESGAAAASGVYFAVVESDGKRLSKKLTLIR